MWYEDKRERRKHKEAEEWVWSRERVGDQHRFEQMGLTPSDARSGDW
jgi:hypothetical protein